MSSRISTTLERFEGSKLMIRRLLSSRTVMRFVRLSIRRKLRERFNVRSASFPVKLVFPKRISPADVFHCEQWSTRKDYIDHHCSFRIEEHRRITDSMEGNQINRLIRAMKLCNIGVDGSEKERKMSMSEPCDHSFQTNCQNHDVDRECQMRSSSIPNSWR